MEEKLEFKTLNDIIQDIWRAKLWVFGAVLFGVFFAAAFVFLATPHYKSHIIISPSNPVNGAESSSLMADENLFALRYIMQRVGAGTSSDFMRFENTLSGESVAKILLRDPKIVAGLKADRSFIFSQIKRDWNAAEFSEYIDKNVRLENVGTTPLRRLVYAHPNANFGQYFLTALHDVTDGLIRNTIRNEASQRISHLRDSVRVNTNPDHRRALTSLLMEQERLLMLTSVETPYAASVIEPASSSVKAIWPNKALVYSAFVGAFALIGFVLHGFFTSKYSAHISTTRPVSAARWFKNKSDNTNHPLTGGVSKWVENKRDVA